MLVGRGEIALDPGRAQCRGPRLGIAAADHQLGEPRLPPGADRRVPLQPIGGDIVRL